MNSVQNSRQAPEEIRVLVACDVGAMRAEREMLERAVFPELRRMCTESGIVFTDIDLLRHAGDVSQEHLLRSCIEEIHRNNPFIICLLGAGGSEIAAGIVQAVGETPGRAWFYAHHDVLKHEGSRAVLRSVRKRGARLREGWRDTQVVVSWVHDDLAAVLAGIAPPERSRALERERRAHEAFASSRRIGTLVRPEPARLLDEHAEKTGPPLLILGASGVGKSTLLAQWHAAYRLRVPDAFVIAHHVGASSTGQTGEEVARRVIEEIGERTGAAAAPLTGGTDPVRELPLALAHLGHERLVLLLDGVDQLADGASLEWLPAFLPATVRLVVTSTHLPDAAAAGEWSIHRLQGLTRNERLALGALYTDRTRTGLAGEHIAHVANDASLATPLALRIRLEEIRLKGGAGRHRENAAHFAAAAGVEDLMTRLVAHWEGEFGTEPVSRLLTGLAGARAGLTHREVAEYVGGSELDLADMLTALDLHLLRMDGRIRFHHDAFRRAVEARYLSGAVERNAVHVRLAELFAGTAAADYGAGETAWHLRQAGDREGLVQWIRRPDVARAFVVGEREHELVEHWMFAADTDAMVAVYTAAIDALDADPPRDRIALMLDIGAILHRAGRVRDSLALLRRAADLAREPSVGEHDVNGPVAVQLASLLAAAGSLRESEDRYRSGLAALRAEHGEEHPTVARILGELAGVLAATGRHAEAEQEYRAALRMMERCGAGEMQLASAVNDLATVLHETARYREAEALYRRSLDLWSSCGGEAHPDAVATVSNLAALHFDSGEHAAARAERERVVALWERALGRDHPMVATALSNLATQISREDPEAALPLLQRALAIHEAAYSTPTHETAVFLYTIGRAHYYAGRPEVAEGFMRRAYELQRELLGVVHVDTAVTLNGLALVMRDRGDDIIAEHLLRQALDVFERLLGARHPHVVSALTNLAEIVQGRGDRDEARRLAVRALEALGDAGSGATRRHHKLRTFLADHDTDGE